MCWFQRLIRQLIRELFRCQKSRAEPEVPAAIESGSAPPAVVGVPSSIPRWQYTPLDKSHQEIRLLEIIPGSTQDCVLACRLQTESLNDEPTYVALSYVWGDASVKEEIALDDKPFLVPVNLAAALKALRSHFMPNWKEYSPLRVWADAIRINQNDLLERNDQVKMMRSIYLKASLVISWLGVDESFQIQIALAMIKVIAQEIRRDERNLQNLSWMQKYPLLLEHQGSGGAL